MRLSLFALLLIAVAACMPARAACPLGTEGYYSLDGVRLVCTSRD